MSVWRERGESANREIKGASDSLVFILGGVKGSRRFFRSPKWRTNTGCWRGPSPILAVWYARHFRSFDSNNWGFRTQIKVDNTPLPATILLCRYATSSSPVSIPFTQIDNAAKSEKRPRKHPGKHTWKTNQFFSHHIFYFPKHTAATCWPLAQLKISRSI